MTDAGSETTILRVGAWNILRSELGAVEQYADVMRPCDLDVIGFTEVPKGDWTALVAQSLERSVSR